jgi:hypothetical protein
MAVPRASLTATMMTDGRVLLAGGYGGSNASWISGERFDQNAAIVGIANPDLHDGTSGTDYGTMTLVGTTTASGSPAYSFAIVAGTLPPGLQFNNGVITGTPNASGAYYFGVKVSDGLGHDATLTLEIRIDPLSIVTTSLPAGQVGHGYSTQLQAQGGHGTLTWNLATTAGSLPPGLTLNGDGSITGIPTQQGVVAFTVEVHDSVGQMATRWFSLNVVP